MAALEHIVLLKANAGQEAELDAVLPECERLVAGIPGVDAVVMRRNLMPGAPGGFTHVSWVRFVDPESRTTFGPHPLHLESAALMNRFVESFAIVDFEAAP